jgi:hypothetical protein
MKPTALFIFMLSITANSGWAQGGWIKDTNPANDAATYTTTYPYVGASFIELNGDRYVDIFAPPTTLLMNNGNGTFSEIISLPFTPTVAISGSSSADIDNDGDNDLVIACVPSRVFFNDGLGSFTDSSAQVPAFTHHGSWAVAVGDYNEDRELDFIFAYSNGSHPGTFPAPCRLYQQQLPLFNPVQVEIHPFTDSLSSYSNPYWSDYDLDGDMDLFIANGPGDGTSVLDFCYKNLKIELGVDSLERNTSDLFAQLTQDGKSYNFIDYDNDLDLDLCITNDYGAPSRLFRNDGGIYIVGSTPFTNLATNVANCWGDYDNDGDQDVIITNKTQPTKYYRNDGSGFTYLAGGFSTPTATNGIANADYDNDGDLDIFINGLGSNGNTSSVGLYINDTVAANRNFVNLDLIGTTSNRSAIGAIVRLRALINGYPVWQMREVNAQNTHQGQNDLRVHIGLGNATIIDSLVITWPSGLKEMYTNQDVNAFYQITEGAGFINLSAENIELSQAISIFPNPTSQEVQINLSPTFENETFHYELTDMYGNIIQQETIHHQSRISLEDLSSGIYFIRINNLTSTVVKKIIKQ